MISAEQIKASRALLGWSAAELAKRSTVGATTLRRYEMLGGCLLYTSPSPRDQRGSRMPSSA